MLLQKIQRLSLFSGRKDSDRIACLLAAVLVFVMVLPACIFASQGGPSALVSPEESLSSGQKDHKLSESEQLGGLSEREKESGKVLTLMVYICGSDLESGHSSASTDLEEILFSGINTDLVNVVVMAGGTMHWKNDFDEKETAIYELASGGSSAGNGGALHWEKKEAYSSPEEPDKPLNMGEADTLQKLLDYGYDEYPAYNYALIMWDHGGGPLDGLCKDTVWEKDCIKMEEFTGALEKSPFKDRKLSWIGLDTCLMSSIETACLLSPYAGYMIASEATEPSLGWDYSFLAGIEEDKTSGETGQRIVDSYIEACKAAGKGESLTLAVIDLSQAGNVEEKMNTFFGTLADFLSEESFSELSNLRGETRDFSKKSLMGDYSSGNDLVDLKDLVSHYRQQAPDEGAALDEALQQMIVYSKSTMDNCCGLSSYHPYNNKRGYEKKWRSQYDSFDFARNYTEYIDQFAAILLGEPLGDYKEINDVESVESAAQAPDGQDHFSVQLTQEQYPYYASSDLMVFMQAGPDDSNGGYAPVFTTNDVNMLENGRLNASYNGRSLYAVDGNDQSIAGPLTYSVSDDGRILIEADYISNRDTSGQPDAHVMFECRPGALEDRMEVVNQYVYDDNDWSTRMAIDEKMYDEVHFARNFREPVYDGNTMRPFSEWQDKGQTDPYRVALPTEIHFRFLENKDENVKLFVSFEITDTQMYRHSTNLHQIQ